MVTGSTDPGAHGQLHQPRRPPDGSIAALVSAGLAGVGGLYTYTHSVVVTVIAVVMVVVLVAMVLTMQR